MKNQNFCSLVYIRDSIFSPTQSNCYFHCFVKRLAKFSGQHFIFTKRFPQVSILIAAQKIFLPKCSSGRKGVFARSLQADNKKSAQTTFCYLTISLVILSSNDVRLLKITFSSTLGNDFTSSTELKTTEFGTASKSFYYCNYIVIALMQSCSFNKLKRQQKIFYLFKCPPKDILNHESHYGRVLFVSL